MTCKLLQWEVIAYSALDTGKHEGVYTEYLQLTTFFVFCWGSGPDPALLKCSSRKLLLRVTGESRGAGDSSGLGFPQAKPALSILS